VLRVIGIDPGTLSCGYGIVEKETDGLRHITSGILNLPKKEDLSKRLGILYRELKKILIEFSPEYAAVEKVFFARNVKAALNLGHARGVVLLCLAEEGIKITEYSANEVKKAVTGYGRADKNQIQKMVQNILRLPEQPKTDSADALALAICHINTERFRSL
jgi:crossover junction endodeoxyribonuclease RuvC